MTQCAAALSIRASEMSCFLQEWRRCVLTTGAASRGDEPLADPPFALQEDNGRRSTFGSSDRAKAKHTCVLWSWRVDELLYWGENFLLCCIQLPRCLSLATSLTNPCAVYWEQKDGGNYFYTINNTSINISDFCCCNGIQWIIGKSKQGQCPIQGDGSVNTSNNVSLDGSLSLTEAQPSKYGCLWITGAVGKDASRETNLNVDIFTGCNYSQLKTNSWIEISVCMDYCIGCGWPLMRGERQWMRGTDRENDEQ